MWNKSKYRSKKVVVDGVVFDSKKEAKRWDELRVRETLGEISGLKRQVRFELIPPQREPDTKGPKGGVHKGRLLERGCDYIADFVYWDKSKDCLIVEDTKGMRTTDYVIKRKLMLYIHGIQIQEV